MSGHQQNEQQESRDRANKILMEWAFKTLSAFVIPVVIYAFNLGTSLQLQNQALLNLQKEVDAKKVSFAAELSAQKASHSEEVKELKERVKALEGDVQNGWNKVTLNAQELKHLRDELTGLNEILREVHVYILTLKATSPSVSPKRSGQGDSP
jgi:hypothetical protein